VVEEFDKEESAVVVMLLKSRQHGGQTRPTPATYQEPPQQGIR